MTRLSASLCLSILLLAGPASAQVINEFVVNHSGTDLYEFLEVSGEASTDYSDLSILEIDGDSAGNPGLIESAWTVGSTDGDGIWWSGYLGDEFPTNDSLTFLLVRDFTGVLQDVDTNNSGDFDVTPWSEILDGVGVGYDDDASDRWYGSATVLHPNYDGVNFVPGGASRIPNGTDTDADTDWTRNDFNGEGLPLPGGLDPGEAVNTPGALNSTEGPPPPPPLISEVVFDHVGATDDHEYIEIFGEANSSHSAYSLLIVEGDSGENPGHIENVFQGGTTTNAGFWSTGFQTEQFEDFSSKTVLLVEGFTGSQGDDLDVGDDGVLDEPQPWTALHDSVAVSDGFGVLYSPAVVLHPLETRSVPVPHGLSRFPWFVDTDSAADWVINDQDLAGIDGFPGTIETGEAYNTPDRANRIHVPDYYASVGSLAADDLRAALHEIIDDHIKHPYSDDSFPDTWDILESADEDPEDSNAILDVYKNESITKFGGGSGPYNREHTWAKTYGFSNDGPTISPYSDCHHLFLSHVGYNSDRGSRVFDECSSGCAEDPTDVNGGVGGGTRVYPGWSNWYTSGTDGSNGSWETWQDRRGDVARAQFYMDVRYEGGTHGETGATEQDLVLTDQRALIQSTSGPTAYMGLLSVLLEWHREDPVDDKERRRNEIVSSHQGNRNPFIDHPEWVQCLFEGACLLSDGFESGDLSNWSTP